MRSCAHVNQARDLPDDVLCKGTAAQVDSCARGLDQIPRYLNDEGVGISAIELDVTGDFDCLC